MKKVLKKIVLQRHVSPADLIGKKAQKWILGGSGGYFGDGYYCRCGTPEDGWGSGCWTCNASDLVDCLSAGNSVCGGSVWCLSSGSHC